MDKRSVDSLIRDGKQQALETRVLKMRRDNEEEHKRVNMRAMLIRQGVSPEKIELLMDRRYTGELREVRPHKRPDVENRKAVKKNMKSRRR